MMGEKDHCRAGGVVGRSDRGTGRRGGLDRVVGGFLGLLPEIDTLVLGGGAYPGYEQYWLGILANPQGVQPLTGKVPSQSEVAYARFADTTPHLVLSRTLDTVAWKTTRIVRDVADIGALKQQPGKAIHAVGGASLVSTL